VLIDVTRGTLGLYEHVIDSHIGPNIVIADFPLRWTVVGMGKLYDVGINAVIPNQRAIPASLLEAKIKNRSRMHYMMANIEVSGYEGNNNWALLLDTDGFLAEGTGANIFLIKDDKLFTPEPRNILCGVTRAYIIEELAPSLGIQVVEKNLEIYDLYNADEAFFTSTPFCMLPIISTNGISIGNGQVGKIFYRLISKWSKNLGVDIIGQIKEWNKNYDEKINAPTTYRFNNE
jgi:branched-chain amino acid aminotransferase